MLTVKVNLGAATDHPRDEVFITSDTSEKSTDPYVNYTVYAKPGLFKDGQLSASAVEELTERSNKELAAEHEAKLAEELKARTAETETKTAAPKKSEG